MTDYMTDVEREAFVDQVVALYDEGKSIREIAIATGRSFGTVRTALVVAGVEMRTRWHVPRQNP